MIHLPLNNFPYDTTPRRWWKPVGLFKRPPVTVSAVIKCIDEFMEKFGTQLEGRPDAKTEIILINELIESDSVQKELYENAPRVADFNVRTLLKEYHDLDHCAMELNRKVMELSEIEEDTAKEQYRLYNCVKIIYFRLMKKFIG